MEGARVEGDDGGASSGSQRESRWRQILQIIEEITAPGIKRGTQSDPAGYAETITAQQRCIVGLVEQLYLASADLWLPPWLLTIDDRETGIPPMGSGMQSVEEVTPAFQNLPELMQQGEAHPDSPLMRAAIEANQTCYLLDNIPEYEREPVDRICIGSPGGDAAKEVAFPVQMPGACEPVQPLSLGVILVSRPDGPPFSQLAIDQLEALARQIGLSFLVYRRRVVDESRLVKLIERQQIVDRMSHDVGLLSTESSLDSVLDQILLALDGTLPFDQSTIWMFEKDAGPAVADPGSIQLAAVRSPGGLHPPHLETGLRLADFLGEDLSRDMTTLQDSWMLSALDSDQPVLRAEGVSDDPIGDVLGLTGSYSAVSGRLKTGEQTFGILTLAHHSQETYGGGSLAKFSTFVDSAAIVIKNALLYETAHEQAWISTVLLEVVDAIQSISDLSELLSTVLRIARMVAGVKTCSLYMLENGDTFVPAVAAGLSPEQSMAFEGERFSRSEVPAVERMLASGAPAILDENTDDLRLSGVLYAGLDADSLFADELHILLPLIAHGEVLGGILVSYAVDLLRGDSQRVMELFFDQHLPILQGIAHQAAVAIDNERLLKAQKEEAYVSVAMLQIAQAVATQRELAQTLETIVRITPLLVGVQRVVVYLYDEQSEVFELVESYGLPQEFTLNQFVPNEFAMLDAVCSTNTFLAVPAALEWDETEDIHDAWVRMRVPVLDEVQETITIDIPLTFFFPLSVQDDVFGVMLVEEADQSSGDVLTRGSSIGGLRGRRMELLDGISKQVSLAVQNDLLQQDTLERERLERELQLAREIQRAFLPRSLPQLPGWEVDARWRTARQVGGDFYDCFRLADGKICLVIADVADKGMPAALYMTLVRTLVRAAAKDHLSPSAVLLRVNDILVPDSQQGMFVTVFFAVLSTDTGELVYANAGQNPPLWVRHREAGLMPLEKGGMALGVLEGNRIEQRTITLRDGDFLILYTDGLTEAVSAGGEMFGEERLIGAVRRAVFDAGQDERELSADALIDRLDQQVSGFVGNAPRADDLTLLVLKKIARDGDQELKKSPDLGGASPAI